MIYPLFSGIKSFDGPDFVFWQIAHFEEKPSP